MSGAIPPQTLPWQTAPSLRAQKQCLAPTAIPCSTMGMPQPSLAAAPPSNGTAGTRVHVQGSARDSLDSVADASPEGAHAPDATDNGGAPCSRKVRVSQLHEPGCVEAMAAVPHHACNEGSSDLPPCAALSFSSSSNEALPNKPDCPATGAATPPHPCPWRIALKDIYSHVNPTKINDVDFLVNKYRGHAS